MTLTVNDNKHQATVEERINTPTVNKMLAVMKK